MPVRRAAYTLRRDVVHWSQTSEGSTGSQTSETHLGNGSVDDALLAELVQETLGDLERDILVSRPL